MFHSRRVPMYIQCIIAYMHLPYVEYGTDYGGGNITRTTLVSSELH